MSNRRQHLDIQTVFDTLSAGGYHTVEIRCYYPRSSFEDDTEWRIAREVLRGDTIYIDIASGRTLAEALNRALGEDDEQQTRVP